LRRLATAEHIAKDTLREMSDTLSAGDSALVVAVNPQGSDLEGLLSGAQKAHTAPLAGRARSVPNPDSGRTMERRQ
jgi:hypothetical protein